LNSFFYPTAGDSDTKIREVTPLPEARPGVACRCSCWSDIDAHELTTFDVLICTGLEAKYSGIFFQHSSLCQSGQEHHPVHLLAFFNRESWEEDEFSWRSRFYKDLKGKAPTIPKGVVDAHCVNLSRTAELLRDNGSIEIDGKELGTVGREWLKLLSMCFWASKDGKRYVAPEDSASDAAVNSALTILEWVTEAELDACIMNERWEDEWLRAAREEAEKQAIEVCTQRVRQRESMRFARSMLELDWTLETIADVLEMSVDALTDAVDSRRRALMSRKPVCLKLSRAREGFPVGK
jgi:hypothetical protein